MSRFRGSPPRSPFRSPPRLYETQRDAIIQDQIRIKSAIKAQTDYRRINDELALLQIKVRHTNELQDKVESLMRQNNQLARDNDDLARQLSERRYELQRLRITASQHHERESIRNAQITEANRALQLEIELTKKERMESTRLFETHIDKLQRTLDAKVMELDAANFKCSQLSKELELTVIRFEEQRNRLKNLMTRTEHQLQRQLQYTKQKQTSEKFSEIDILKRNHAAQLTLLEDQISKIKLLNQVKSQEFQSQLAQNRNLRKRHDEQVRLLGAQNDDLRARMLKLEEINRSQVETIQVKYSDIHAQGTTNLKQQHNRQIKLLLEEIDKLKWLVSEKNAQIQNLVQDKRQLRRTLDETQLQLGSQIQSLRNQKYIQQEKYTQQSHNQMAKINELINNSKRDSDSYHKRAIEFRDKIASLEGQINDKQNSLDRNKKEYEANFKQLNRQYAQLNYKYEKTRIQLTGSQDQRAKAQARHKQYQADSQKSISQLSKKLSETQVKLQQTSDKLQRQIQDHKGNSDTSQNQIKSLRQQIQVLNQQLSNQRTKHFRQLSDFSNKSNDKLKSLQAAQKKAIESLERGFKEQLQASGQRIQKLQRQNADAQSQLKRYIDMYRNLEQHIKNPQRSSTLQRAQSRIYQVLSKVTDSSINIF